MVTAEVVFALIGSLLFKSAISASINDKPNKITVNAISELQALEPGALHQGANFYFKPQLNLPQSFIPSYIEALISLIQQRNHSCAKDASKVVVEKDKLIEILQPFMYPLLENSKEKVLENVLEKDNNLEIVKPPQIIEKNVTEPLPVIITEEPKPVTPELLVIPEALVLPQYSLEDVPAFIKKQVKKEESVILEEPKGEYLTIPETAVRPIMEPLINYVEPKLMTAGLVNISDAPVLPPFSLNDIPPIVEEIRKDKTAIVEGQKEVFSAIPEIALTQIQDTIINYIEPELNTSDLLVNPEARVLTPLTSNDIKLIEEGVKIEESVAVDVESKPAIQEYVTIPEAPILPPLALHDISPIMENEVKKEEFIIFEDAMGVFSTIPEIAVRPIQEQIIKYVEPELTTSDLLVIPEAPVLPTFSAKGIHVLEEVKIEEPVVVDVEPNPVIQELVIPEAPILPPLSLKSIPFFIEEKPKKEESTIFEEPTGVLSTISEIVVRPIEEPTINYVKQKPTTADVLVIPEAPVLPTLSANDIDVLEEVKIEEPIVFDFEPAIATQELVIPEAPILPPLSFITSAIEEEAKKEESIIFDSEMGELPSIPKISSRPISEPIVVSETAESFALENNVFPVAKEEVKTEVPILLEETIAIFPPIAEISSGRTLESIQEPEMNNSYVLEEDSQPNPELVVTVKETLHPTIIPTPSNNLGVFSYAPFVSHLPKPASLDRFLLKKRPYFKLPVTPFLKRFWNEMKVPIWRHKKHFFHPTSHAHYVGKNGIAPSMAFKKNAPPKRVKSYIRSQVPKRPSYL